MLFDRTLQMLVDEGQRLSSKTETNRVHWRELARFQAMLNRAALDAQLPRAYRRLLASAAAEVGMACQATRPPDSFRVDGYVEDVIVLYDKPSGVVLTELPNDVTVELLGRTPDGLWLYIMTDSGQVGWVESFAVETNVPLDNLDVTWVKEESSVVAPASPTALYDDPAYIVSGGEHITDTYSDESLIPIDTTSQLADDENQFDTIYESSDSSAVEPPIQEAVETPIDVPVQADPPLEEVDKPEAKFFFDNWDNREIEISDDDIELELEFYSDKEVDSLEAYVSLWLADNPILTEFLYNFRYEANNDEIDWQPSSKLHITLAYANSISDASLDSVCKLLPETLNSLPVQIGPVSVFNNDLETVIILLVQPSDALTQLQQKINVAFGAQGVSMSPHSNPAQYVPHITLGYAPAGYVLPTVNFTAELHPEQLVVQRDSYQTVHTIPIENKPQAVDINQMRLQWAADLTEWQQSQICPETLGEHIRQAVEHLITTGLSLNEILPSALRAVEEGSFDQTSAVNPLIKYIKTKAYQDSAEAELNAWELKTLKGGLRKGRSFESKFLTDSVRGSILEMLNATDDVDKATIRDIFALGRTMLGETP